MARKTAEKPKRKVKPKLTTAERHKRFVAMAHEVEADDLPEAFDRAFEVIVGETAASQRRPKRRP